MSAKNNPITESTLVPVKCQSAPNAGSIPATLVLKSDGSITISSDVINTKKDPIQLVMMTSADGKNNLYMIPKEANSTQTAFLVKPNDGDGWKLGTNTFSSDAEAAAQLPLHHRITVSLSSKIATETNNITGTETVTVTETMKNTITGVPKSSALIGATTDCEPQLHQSNATLNRANWLPQNSIVNQVRLVFAPKPVILSTANTVVRVSQPAYSQTRTASQTSYTSVVASSSHINTSPVVNQGQPTGSSSSGKMSVTESGQPVGFAFSCTQMSPEINVPIVVFGSHGSNVLTYAVISSTKTLASEVQSLVRTESLVQSAVGQGSQSSVGVQSQSSCQIPSSDTSIISNIYESGGKLADAQLLPIVSVSPSSNSTGTTSVSKSSSMYIINGKPFSAENDGSNVRSNVSTTVNPRNFVNSSIPSGAKSSTAITTTVYNYNYSAYTPVMSTRASMQLNVNEEKSNTASKNNLRTTAWDQTRTAIQQVVTQPNHSTKTDSKLVLSQHCILKKILSEKPAFQKSPNADPSTAKETHVPKTVASQSDLARTNDKVSAKLLSLSQEDSIKVELVSSDEDDEPKCLSWRFSPASDDVRPMLLFRNDVARRLKPVLLKDVTSSSSIPENNQPPLVFSVSQSSTPVLSSSVVMPKILSSASVTAASSENRNAGSPAVSLCPEKSSVLNVTSKPSQPDSIQPYVQPQSICFESTKYKSARQTLQDLASFSADKTKITLSSKKSICTTTQEKDNGRMKVSNYSDKGTNTDIPDISMLQEDYSDIADGTWNSGILRPAVRISETKNARNSMSAAEIKEAKCNLKIGSVFSLNPELLRSQANAKKVDKMNLETPNKVFTNEQADCCGKQTTRHTGKISGLEDGYSKQEKTKIDTVVRSLVFPQEEANKEPKDIKMFGRRKIRKSTFKKSKFEDQLRTRNKDCIVVLSRLSMRKFKTPYSARLIEKDIQRFMCSKECRQTAAQTYFKLGNMKTLTQLPSDRPERVVPQVKLPPLESCITKPECSNGCLNNRTVFCLNNRTVSISDPQAAYAPQLTMSDGGNCKEGQDLSRSAEVITKLTVTQHQSPPVCKPVQNTLTIYPSSIVTTDKSKYFVYQIGDKKFLVPIFSSKNAFIQGIAPKQSQAPSTEIGVSVSDTSAVASSTNVSNISATPVLKSAAVSSGLASLPVVTEPKTITGLQDGNQKSEQEILPGRAQNLEVRTALVKSEPLNLGYSDEVIVASHISSCDNTRKRTHSGEQCEVYVSKSKKSDKGEVSKISSVGGAKAAKILKTSAKPDIGSSIIPHNETVRKLKELLKQKQKALEDFRQKRFSDISVPVEYEMTNTER